MNKPAAEINNKAVHRDALKQLIREGLSQRPARAVELADRIGVEVDTDFMEALDEMENSMDISFNWIRGYAL